MKTIHIPLPQLTKILLGYLAIGLCGDQLSLILNLNLHLELSFAVALALIGKDKTIYVCMLGAFILRGILGISEQLDAQTIAVMSAWSALETLVECKVSVYAIRSFQGTRWRRLLELRDFIKLLMIGGVFSSLICTIFWLTTKVFFDNASSINILIILFLKNWIGFTLGAIVFLPIFLSVLLRKTTAWNTRYKSILISGLLLTGIAVFFGIKDKNLGFAIAKAELIQQAIKPSRLISTKIAEIEGSIFGFSNVAETSTDEASTYLSQFSQRIFALNPSIRSLSVHINPKANLLPDKTRANQESLGTLVTAASRDQLLHFDNPRHTKTQSDQTIISQYVNTQRNVDSTDMPKSLSPFNLVHQQKDNLIVRYNPKPFTDAQRPYSINSIESDVSIYIDINISELLSNAWIFENIEPRTPWSSLSLQLDDLPKNSYYDGLPLSSLTGTNYKYEIATFTLLGQVLSLQGMLSSEWIRNYAWQTLLPIALSKIIVALLFLVSVFLITTRQYRLRVLLTKQGGVLDQQNHLLALFQNSIENAQEAIAILKLQNKGLYIEYVNDSFCKMAGQPSSEVIGTVWSAYIDFPINDNALGILKKSIARGAASREEFTMINELAEWCWVDLTLTPIEADEGETIYWLLSQQDISERKRIDLELKRSEAEARNLSATKSRFLENISHEIRTPLSGIIGLTNLAQDSQDPLIIQQHLRTIKTSANHQLEIITSILNALKIEASQIHTTLSNINLSILLTETTDMLQPNAQLKNIALNVKISKNVPTNIQSDPLLLKQILLNLLANAIKFTHKGHVDITLDYLFSNEDSTGIRFSIADSGIGLGSLSLKKITQPFFKGELDTNTDGIGLGLAIVESYLQQMNSHLQAESRNNFGGSTFYFDLSCKHSTQNHEIPVQNDVQELSLTQPTTNDAFVGLRFLMIEDNLINQIVLLGYLNDSGATIDIASNGESALLKIASTEYDLIFLDLRIPKFDTTIISKHLDRVRKDLNIAVRTPIIGISASQQDDYDATLKRYGLSDFLTKPIDQAQLFEVIKKHVFSNTLEIEAARAPSTSFTSLDNRAFPSLELQQLFLEQALISRPIFDQYFYPHAHNALSDALHLIQGSAAALALHDLQLAAQNLEDSIRKGSNHLGNYLNFIQLYDKQIIIFQQFVSAVTPPARQESPLNSTLQSNHPRRHFNILLIDDNILVSKVLGSQIAEKGLSIDFAFNSEEALLKLDTHHYDIVITDLILPDIDGLALTKIITAQSRFKDKIIFGLSAYVSDTIEQGCKAAGMQQLFSKLSDPSALIAALAETVKSLNSEQR